MLYKHVSWFAFLAALHPHLIKTKIMIPQCISLKKYKLQVIVIIYILPSFQSSLYRDGLNIGRRVGSSSLSKFDVTVAILTFLLASP